MKFTDLISKLHNVKHEKSCDINDLKSQSGKLSFSKRWDLCGSLIYKEIESSEAEWALPKVISVIDSIRTAGVLYPYRYTYYDFEAWINKNKSEEENVKCVAKIFGSEGNPYIKSMQFGSGFFLSSDYSPHIITGHMNPDADALCSSFFSWMLASINRVSKISNVWSICGSISSEESYAMLTSLFGNNFFDIVSVQGNVSACRAVSLDWRKGEYKRKDEEDVVIDVDITDLHNDVIAKAASYGASAVNIVFNLGEEDRDVLGHIAPDSLERLSKKGVHLSLRDFSSMGETNVIGKYEIKSIIDHHSIKDLNVKFSTRIRVSDSQSTASLLTKDIKMIVDSSLEKRINVSKTFVRFSSYLLTFALLDDTDGFERLSIEDRLNLASMVSVFDWLDNDGAKHHLPCDEILSVPTGCIKLLLSEHRVFAGFLKAYKEIKESCIRNVINEAISQDLPVMDIKLFSDTKIQNEKCIVGQIKLKESSWSDFSRGERVIKSKWLAKSEFENASFGGTLNIMMISTIGDIEENNIFDKWWIWDSSIDKNKAVEFLSNLSKDDEMMKNIFGITISSNHFEGKESAITEILSDHYKDADVSVDYANDSRPTFELKIKKSSMNGRKRVISPFLPICQDLK